MNIVKNLGPAMHITEQLINDITFMFEMRTKSTYFTRSGKMDFSSIILFALNFVKKSLQIELDSFFKNIKGGALSITKQSYSEARQKISPVAFIIMADAVRSWYYGDDDFKTFHGYRLSAIDGTVLELNNSEKLRETFGYIENQHVKLARASASGIYDIENDMMLTAKITRYGTSERDMAIELINQLEKAGFKKELILFDRGYPSFDFISNLESKGIIFVMRASSNFLKEVNEAKEEDQVLEVKRDGKTIKIRVVRFMLDSGVEEVLITNLFDESFGVKEFKELYFKRWGIESKFNELKSRLQIENFTGDTPIAVEQDFYASIYLSNMVALAKADANREIAEKNEGKELKHEQQVNTNILIGKLKDSLVLMLLEDDPRKRSNMLREIMDEIIKNTVPKRPGRSFERKMGLKSNKYPLNRKRCL